MTKRRSHGKLRKLTLGEKRTDKRQRRNKTRAARLWAKRHIEER